MVIKLKKRNARYRDLTFGQPYVVIGIEADELRILNDPGRPFLYPPRLFSLVDSAEPADWITEIGEDGERYSYPPLLNKPGFFEDFFDDKARAVSPIVRGVVWQALDGKSRTGIYTDLRIYFDAVPRPPDYLKVESIEDLTPAIELYQSLIGLERYQDAFALFRDHLHHATLWRLSASRQHAELLERLFPDGIENLPRLQTARNQSYTLNALALAYQNRGEPGRSVLLLRRAFEIDERETTPRMPPPT